MELHWISHEKLFVHNIKYNKVQEYHYRYSKVSISCFWKWNLFTVSSRILLFDNTSLDALLVLYICIYELCFLYCLICICQNIVCSSLVEEIKNIIITYSDAETEASSQSDKKVATEAAVNISSDDSGSDTPPLIFQLMCHPQVECLVQSALPSCIQCSRQQLVIKAKFHLTYPLLPCHQLMQRLVK